MLKVATMGAVAAVGAGAVLEETATTAFATGTEGQTTFTSATASPTVTIANTSTGSALVATTTNSAPALSARNSSGIGVRGQSTGNNGVEGLSVDSIASGVYGENNNNGFGVAGRSKSPYGGLGSGDGVMGNSGSGPGVHGISTSGSGVFGESGLGAGVYGYSHSIEGVSGVSFSGDGVHGYSATGTGVYGGSGHYAGYFDGNVTVTQNLSKGGGSFKIDHPLDPGNKYLLHSFVESPDMMNVYNGVITLDARGEAVIQLPSWFDALNKEFRYQLTPLGIPAPNLHIAQELNSSRFGIAGGLAGMQVSWQLTGIRQDRWANAHRIPVEVEKEELDRGLYLHPELYGEPEEKGIHVLRSKHRTTARVPDGT